MIIYEVNLCIDNDIYADFQAWLSEHIQEMLKLPGFAQATLLQLIMDDEHKQDSQKNITVQYQLKNATDLQNYFDQYAANMRADGMQRFKDGFSATRRVFEAQEVLKAAIIAT